MSKPDVFVLGGGPAGLAAAIAARRRGFTVTLADASIPPIDKACGEGLMPDSRAAAARLGMEIPDDAGYPFAGIRFAGASQSVSAPFPDEGYGLGVRRTVLHALLVDAAEKAGVLMKWGAPVRDFDAIEARWVIGADGAQSSIRRWAGLDFPVSNTRRFAFRRHFAIAPWTDYMEVHWGEKCQAYVTPVSQREVCVAMIARTADFRLDEALPLFFPELSDRLYRAPATSRERGAVTASMRLRAVARGRVALIGDASGSVDAITGEGICLSFRQAEVLAGAMEAGDLSLYNRAHPRLALRPHLMAKAMLLLDRGPALRDWALGALSAQPWIFKQLLGVHVA